MNAILEAMPFEFNAGEGEEEMYRQYGRPFGRGYGSSFGRGYGRPFGRSFGRSFGRNFGAKNRFARPSSYQRPTLRVNAPRYRTTLYSFPTYNPFATPFYPEPSYPAPSYAAPSEPIGGEPVPSAAIEPATSLAADGPEPSAAMDAGDGAPVEDGEYTSYGGSSAYAPYSSYPRYTPPAPVGSPYVRWVQHRLNQLLGTSIRKSGIMDVASRSALLRFQRRYGLRVSGVLDLATRAALRVPPLPPMPPVRRVISPYSPSYRATTVQAEIPPLISSLINSDKNKYPQYSHGPVPIQQIGAQPGLNVPGLYLITFTHKGQRRAYSGMTDNLHNRLTQHFRCLSFTGELERPYDVYYQKIPFPAGVRRTKALYDAHMQKIRDLESALNSQRARLGGILVNRTTELEA